jgi:hypothetical protein
LQTHAGTKVHCKVFGGEMLKQKNPDRVSCRDNHQNLYISRFGSVEKRHHLIYNE